MKCTCTYNLLPQVSCNSNICNSIQHYLVILGIEKTCNNGGCLQIVMKKPRKNAVKLLLLMDSGGTMIPYSSLLNDLFQAIHKSNHYKDVKTYYFHNCIYAKLYNTPECENGDWIDSLRCVVDNALPLKEDDFKLLDAIVAKKTDEITNLNGIDVYLEVERD